MSVLRSAVQDAAVIFVVGKGGVGKTTAAGGLALELADAEQEMHLISTDPAHSLSDLFEQPIGGDVVASRCNPRLTLEEFDADSYAGRWLARAIGPVSEIVEHGTYLEHDDVVAFSRLALPGLDEMMAVLRLVDVRRDGHRFIVDTAPTGHALRLLDAPATHDSIARALDAMAAKAAAVAGALAGRAARLSGESIIEELRGYADAFREQVLADAVFVLATRPDPAVEAETDRLRHALRGRGLHVAALVSTGGPAVASQEAAAGAPVTLHVPLMPPPRGCDALRAWRERLGVGPGGAAPEAAAVAPARAPGRPALHWLRVHAPRLLLFAGKGGVGKTTCAAAAALALAEDRDVLLCSADPAGSLDDVFAVDVTGAGTAAPRLRVLQVDPAARLAHMREAYRADMEDVLVKLGVGGSAALDRRVMEALWELTPPGIDELTALSALLDAAGSNETVVLDTAPTGHFLRLLTMPGVALDWIHQLMRVIVRYGITGATGNAAASLLQLARELRSLQTALHDPAHAGVCVVTLAEPLVLDETQRLLETLADAAVPVAAVVLNRAAPDAAAPARLPPDVPVVRAPFAAQVTGSAALREFIGTWKIET